MSQRIVGFDRIGTNSVLTEVVVTPAGEVATTGSLLKSIIETGGTATYVGEALPGTATTASAWRIKRVYDHGTHTDVTWAGGSTRFAYRWDDRTSYSYD